MNSILQCPVCRELLVRSPGGYRCAHKHTFDAARQGYVNFLLAHKKHSREPGDGPEMIRSRRRFLELGLYNRVSDGINEAVAAALPPPRKNGAFTILDAGCGEGFYLKRLEEALARRAGGPIPADYYGIDISKYAVRTATQRDKAMNWFVASVNDLPFATSSLDIIVNIFSPANFAEFSRLLGDAGKLVVVSPGPRHLDGLRELIYPVAREHSPTALAGRAGEFFSLASEARIAYPLELKNNGEIMDLLSMTPYFWHIDLKTKSTVEALDRLALKVDVMIRVLQKNNDN